MPTPGTSGSASPCSYQNLTDSGMIFFNSACIKKISYFGNKGSGTVPDHDGGRPMEVNACILITHMVYL